MNNDPKEHSHDDLPIEFTQEYLEEHGFPYTGSSDDLLDENIDLDDVGAGNH